MKSSLEFWRHRTSYTLAEAALLITGNYPDVLLDEMLPSQPPKGFVAIFGKMLHDVNLVVDFGRNEYSNEVENVYALNTSWPRPKEVIEKIDGLSVTVEKSELQRWLKANDIYAKFFDDESLAELAINDAGDTVKPLSTRERNTLLVIIAALAKEARIDIGTPSKAGGIIASLTEEMGAAVDSETIAGKLKLIPDALESRAK